MLYFKVEGMTCAGCESTLQSMIGTMDGVVSAKANHQWGLLEVRLDEARSKTELEGLKAAILKEVQDVFPLEPIESHDNVFDAAQPHENKTTSFIQKALLNVVFGLAFYFGASFLPLALWSQSLLMGSLVNLSVLGLMAVTGRGYYEDAWAKFKIKRTSMNTLIALSTLTAWSVSALAVVLPSLGLSAFGFMPIFMILGITNIGRAFRAHQEAKAHDMMLSLDALFKDNQPRLARVLNPSDKTLTLIPFQMVEPGTVLVIEEGERFPVDGKALGKTYVNQKILTGETLASVKEKGEMIYAGTLNTQGRVKIQATVNGRENTLLKLLEQVRNAQMKSTKPGSRMDTIIQWFVPTVMGVAGLSALGWLAFTGSLAMSFNALTGVLLCACPCALGLAAPLSEAFGIYKLLHKNILVKDADKLEALTKVDTLVFDKTGTISEPKVHEMVFSEEMRAQGEQILASLEKPFVSLHPIAKACFSHYEGSHLCEVTDSQKHDSGQGISGNINDESYIVGSRALMMKSQCVDEHQIYEKAKQLEAKGMTPIYLAKDKVIHGVIGIRHELKPGVLSTLNALKSKAHRLILLTGDSQHATETLIEGLPFDKVLTQRTSDEKQAYLEKLKRQGKHVAYVGDGINDLKAAQTSDVAISIGPWTHLASIAQISLKGDIRDLPKCFELSELIQSNIRQNLNWTFLYNTVSLVVASGLLYPLIGMTFNPIIFAATMAVSSIVVVANASRLPSILDAAWKTPQVVKPTVEPLNFDTLELTTSKSLMHTELSCCNQNQTLRTQTSAQDDSSMKKKRY